MKKKNHQHQNCLQCNPPTCTVALLADIIARNSSALSRNPDPLFSKRHSSADSSRPVDLSYHRVRAHVSTDAPSLQLEPRRGPKDRWKQWKALSDCIHKRGSAALQNRPRARLWWGPPPSPQSISQYDWTGEAQEWQFSSPSKSSVGLCFRR